MFTLFFRAENCGFKGAALFSLTGDFAEVVVRVAGFALNPKAREYIRDQAGNC